MKKGMERKVKRNSRIAVLSLLLAAMMMLAAGCGATKLADAFDEDTVLAAAKEATGYMTEEDYESVCNMLRDDLKEQLTAEILKENMDTYFADRGAFTEYKSTAVIGQKMKDTGEDTAVAVIIAVYENQKITFTVSFDTNMKVIGFFMK